MKKMKKIFLIMVAMFTIITCYAGNVYQKIPDAVLKSCAQQYPQVVIHNWEVKNDTCIARFEMAKRKMWAYFAPDGSWIKTEVQIPWSKDLPYTVKSSLRQSPFYSWYIDDMKEIERPGKNTYAIQVHEELGPEGAIPGDWVDTYVLYYKPDGSFYKEKHIE